MEFMIVLIQSNTLVTSFFLNITTRTFKIVIAVRQCGAREHKAVTGSKKGLVGVTSLKK